MAGKLVRGFFHKLGRRKFLDNDELLDSSGLKRALGLVDLIGLGVGSTLGVGVYVLAGSVAKETAGPAVVVSFLIAGVASAFAGLCYAEFAARVPKAGSAYVYSYVCVGEFVAFIIGWNLILEYVVGIIAFGVKESSAFNNVVTTVNVTVVIYVITCGCFQLDIANWTIDKEDIPPQYTNAGKGGFAPFGVSGIISGAATCFYGFVGFDCIATTGEEAKNPQRNIPIAIIVSLVIIFLGYLGISTVLTMMWPYYAQDSEAPLPHVFEEIGWYVAAWIVTIGALFGLCASLMGSMFPLPRIIYAMCNDGLLFKFLGRVSKRFQTPTIGTLFAGVLIGLLSALFDLQQLVDMMSIGTLLAYSIVAACVLLLRYQPGDSAEIQAAEIPRDIPVWRQLFNFDRLRSPSTLSASICSWAVLIYIFMALWLCCVVRFALSYVQDEVPWAIFLIAISAVCAILTLVIIGLQPTSKKKLNFTVPLVPALPGLSIFINLYLMLSLDGLTWIRFLVWMAIGFLIYFCYGIWKSEKIHHKLLKNHKHSIIDGFDNKSFVADLDSKTIDHYERSKL